MQSLQICQDTINRSCRQIRTHISETHKRLAVWLVAFFIAFRRAGDQIDNDKEMETKLTRKELLKIWIIKNSGRLARALTDKRFVVFTEYQKEIEDASRLFWLLKPVFTNCLFRINTSVRSIS